MTSLASPVFDHLIGWLQHWWYGVLRIHRRIIRTPKARHLGRNSHLPPNPPLPPLSWRDRAAFSVALNISAHSGRLWVSPSGLASGRERARVERCQLVWHGRLGHVRQRAEPSFSSKLHRLSCAARIQRCQDTSLCATRVASCRCAPRCSLWGIPRSLGCSTPS